jgi:hypothetical protein
MELVTQSNLGQTQELSSTAQTLSGEAARLSGLVKVLLVTYTGKDRRGSRSDANYKGPERRGRENRRSEIPGADAGSGGESRERRGGSVVEADAGAGERRGGERAGERRERREPPVLAMTANGRAQNDSFEEF